MQKVTISPAKIQHWFNNLTPTQRTISGDEGNRLVSIDFSQEEVVLKVEDTELKNYPRTDLGLDQLLTQLRCMGIIVGDTEAYLAEVIDETNLNATTIEDIIAAKKGESTGPTVDPVEPVLETPVIEAPKSNWKDKLSKATKVGQYIAAGLVLVAGAVVIYKLFESDNIIDAASTVGDVIDGVAEAGEAVTSLLG